MLSDADLPLVIEGVVRFQSNSGTFPKKEGCLILKVDKRGEYALVVRQNLGKTWEVKVKHMYSNKSYFEQTKDRTKGETKIIVQFKDKGNNASTAYLEDADPAEVKRFCRCLDQAKHRKSAQNRVPTGRIVSQRTSPPMAAQPLDTPTPDLDGLTPSKKRPRSQENQTPNKSLRQAGNTSTPIKQERQATPAKGEQTPSRTHTPLRVPTPRPDSKHTPGRDSSLSRFKREHGGVDTEAAVHSTGANLRENTKQNDRSPSVLRKGNSGFLESAKKKFEAGDEKRKFSAVSLSTSFYSNPAPKNYTIPKYRPGIMPAPQPRRLHQAENYTGWSDKNKGLVKSQAQPSLQGFSNLGNTCYMNAILQALRGMETFSIDLINREVIRAVEETTLYRNIAALFRYCNKPTEKQEAFRKQQFLKGVKTAVSSSAQRFSGYLQHDAHEFLSQCLDQLKEDVKKVRSDKAKDNGEDKESLSDSSDDHGLPCPVSQNFQFEVIHTISCKSCGDVVTKQEKFHDLSLTLPRRRKDMNPWSLQDLLDQFFISEDLEYTCKQCESKQSRVSHHFIKLPRVLILHLKRYNYNHAMSENRKMEQPVFLPLYLTLQSHCTEETHPCRPPSIPPPLHPPTERRTDTGDNRNAATSAKKSFSFRPSKAYERIQMMESSEDESLGNRNVKKESQPAMEEDIELQKAIQLSKQTAEAEKFQQSLFLMSSDSDFTSTSDFTLDNVTEEEQLRRALENSMQESETPVPVTPQPHDMTLMSPCVLTPLNKESNKKQGFTKGLAPSKPSSQKPPPEAKLFSVVSEDKNLNGAGGKDASTMLDFFEGEEETFEIKYTEEPQTVGLCGGNDNPRYASPGQVKRRHHSEGGGSKLGLSSSKKKRLSSPGGGGRANKTLPFAKSNGQRTLGKWLRKNCFTSSDVGVKASCGEVQGESDLSDKCDAIPRGIKEEKRAPEDNSTEDDELQSFTQPEGVKRRREQESKPKDESVSTDSSQDEEVQSSTQPKEVKRRREEKSKPKVEIESANSSQDSEIESSTQLDEVITISSSDLEETSESETPQMRTDSPKMATCVWEAVKGSKHESESEQDDFREISAEKKDPKEVRIKTEVVTEIVSEDPDEIVAKFHEKLAEHSAETIKSEATNHELAPSVVTSQRRASSDNNSADPNNNQDLNNNSEADVESESDKENQQPEEEVVGQGSVSQGSVPSLTLPDWVTEHVQQGEQSDRQKEEEDMQRALDESRALQKEREEKEKEELRKVLELSRQEYDQSFEMDPFEEEISEEEDVAMAEFARSMEEAEAIRKNAETGDLPYSYRLVSVVNHIGKKSSSGHYISDVYDMQKRAWLKWDDSHVERTSERYVREKRQTSGYIFFYMNKDCFEDVVAQTRPSDQH